MANKDEFILLDNLRRGRKACKSLSSYTSTNNVSDKYHYYRKSSSGSKQPYTPTINDMLQTASRKTQAIFKISSYGKGLHKIAAHLNYISRRGKLELEDQDGNKLLSLQEQKQILKSWSPDFGDNPRSRDTMHIVLSTPPGTDREKAFNAAKEFLENEYKTSNHEYLFVAHKDTNHPHVHAVIKMLSNYGQKLNPRKAYLHQVRQKYAEICRSHGIDVEASSRAERGLAGITTRSELVQMRMRAHKTQVDTKLVQKIESERQLHEIPTHPSEEKMQKRNQIIRKRYADKATRLALQSYTLTDNTEKEKYYNAAKLLHKYAQTVPVEATRGEKIHQQLDDKLGISPNRTNKINRKPLDQYQAVKFGRKNKKEIYESLALIIAKQLTAKIAKQTSIEEKISKCAELEID
jgi:hypothetical protein